MMEEQLYPPCRNGRTLLASSGDSVSQDRAFDLRKYGPYIDKIRAFFVPSLEHRIYLLLKEFVYNKDSQLVKQSPCFKKFIDTIATWREPLKKVTEYDINTMEETIKDTIKSMIKDGLFTVFLDSIILNNRLNKICRELDALGVKDDILRNLNMWNFINKKDYWMDCHCFTNSNTTMDYNMKSSVETFSDAEEASKCKKAVKPLAINDIYSGENIEHIQPTTSRHQTGEYRQVFKSNQKLLPQDDDHSNHSTCGTSISQRNNTDKTCKCLEKGSRNIETSKKIQRNSRLKLMVRKMYLEDCGCPTFSKPVVTYLSLPCKANNLIKRIFEADPSLSESCLIVMKRKFEVSMYNVCSCLNDILQKLDVKFMKALYFNCEIRPGYIIFKLKADIANNINKCFFVARVSICQNVCKYTLQQNSAASSCKPQCSEKGTSVYSEQRNDYDNNFDNTLAYIVEDNEELSDICSSSSKQNLTKNVTDILTIKRENRNKEESIFPCSFKDHSSDHFIVSSCSTSLEKINETVSNVTSCKSKRKAVQYHKTSDCTDINYNNNMKKYKEDNFKLVDPIVEINEYIQPINNAECTCLSHENLTEMNDGIRYIFSNKSLESSSQDIIKYNQICSSKKAMYSKDESCYTSSIVSIIQNSESDKQLVELNYNRFLDNNIITTDRQSNTEDNSSFNSTKVEIGCQSDCACCYENIIDITDINNISEQGISYTLKVFQDDSTPTSNVSSKATNANINYPYFIIWLTSDDKNASTIVKTRDKRKRTINFPTRALMIAKRRSRTFHNDNKIFDTNIRARSIKPLKGIPIARSYGKQKLVSDANSESSIVTNEYIHVGAHSTCMTSNTSQPCHSFTMSDKKNEFRKSHKWKNISMCNECRSANSNDIRSITSITTIKYRTKPHKYHDYSADKRSLATFMTTKFRNSIDKSVNGIKRLIRTKLGRVLFNNCDRIKNTSKILSQNERSSDDSIEAKSTSGNYIRQSYSITSCSTSGCYRRSYTISHESSDITLSTCKNRGRKKKINKGGIKYNDPRLIDDNEALSSFLSIETSPCFYDFLIPTPEHLENRKLGRSFGRRHFPRKEIIRSERNDRNCNKNFYHVNMKNQETSITVSSQSAKVSFTEDDSESLKHYTCKQKKGICDNKRACKKIHYRDNQENEKERYECRRRGNGSKNCYTPVEYTTSDNSNEFSKISTLPYIWKRNNRKMHKQSCTPVNSKNVKKFSKKKREIPEHNNDTCKRRSFAILTKTRNTPVDDHDYLDFRSKLLRYVELCKNVKQSLLRTLQPDDIYEVNTASMPCSDT